MPMTPCAKATATANAKAKCPSSGIIKSPQAVLFLKKKNQKNFCSLVPVALPRHAGLGPLVSGMFYA
jgi:hypothetical protein